MDGRETIREYLDHLEDAGYVRVLFRDGVEPVVRLLLAMLGGDDQADTQHAMRFIRDVVNYAMVPEFTTALPASGIFPALHHCLYRADWFIRSSAAYTLGKLCFRENFPALGEALYTHRDSDPLLLPGLVREIAWLTNGAQTWQHVQQVASSPLYLSRWAIMDAASWRGLDAVPDTQGRELEHLYQSLADDPHPLVRAEANYRLDQLHLRWHSPPLERSERRRRTKPLRQQEPELGFFELSCLFQNYLLVTNQADYDVATLDAFVRYCQAHPRRQPFDMPAYMRGFPASARRAD